MNVTDIKQNCKKWLCCYRYELPSVTKEALLGESSCIDMAFKCDIKDVQTINAIKVTSFDSFMVLVIRYFGNRRYQIGYVCENDKRAERIYECKKKKDNIFNMF